MTLLRLPALLVASALLIAAAPARADDLQDASRLLRQGQAAQALEKINQHLAAKPRDPQGRFLKGLILAEQNKAGEAIEVFTALTRDYPELPEPYNNLAVLYAAQGQYDRARQALEQSIRTHPSYATAYENLGDVYTKLASQAYDKALQLDSSNTSAQTKLALIRDMVPASGNRPPRPTAVARNDAAPPAAAAKASPAAAPAAATPAAKAAAPTVAAAPKAPPAEAKAAPAPAKAAESKTAGSKAESKGAAGGSDDVARAVRSWAAAWAAQDVKGYLGHYAKNFQTPKGESRAQWEQEREARIKAPKDIDVGVDNLRVSMQDDNTARATFRQSYRSDKLKVNSNKTLVMTRADGRWLIREERVGN